ncbi:MAG: acyl carrier protein [Symploca sp. SIO1A3]|nr:acyl carrier protein [Symploca sp. SIO2C1]NER52586.1 acyl carrier protein [Symploca sp. SIO1A3]
MENLTVENQNTTIAFSTGSVDNKNLPTVDEIKNWLISYLSEMLDLEVEEISTSTSFARYGLDSSGSILLANDLGDWLGREIEPTIIYGYTNIEDLAEYLVE